MRPKEHRESGEHDLFRSRLDQIIDMDRALVKLAGSIDWHFLEERLGAVSDATISSTFYRRVTRWRHIGRILAGPLAPARSLFKNRRAFQRGFSLGNLLITLEKNRKQGDFP